jgi:ERCC4-type nuclease
LITLHKPVPDKELKAAIKTMKIIVDTREQQNQHILDYFAATKIPFVERALDYGDYSCQIELPPEYYHDSNPANPKVVTLEKRIVIERKHSIDEIASNMKSDKDGDANDKTRFEREMMRSKADGCKVVLMLENFSFDRVLKGNVAGNYRSQMQPHVIATRINTFVARYGLHLITLNDKIIAGVMIQQLLARYCYEYLKE